MSRWQRRARLGIGAFGVVFAVVVALAFRRHPPPGSAEVVHTDPRAVIEGRSGAVDRITLSHEDASIRYEKLLTYNDGSSRLLGVTILTQERGSDRSFTVTGKEAKVGQNDSTIAIDGDVLLKSSDGISARTEHATYSKADGSINAPGPVDFTRGRLTGTGVGLKYDKGRDLLSILDQAVVHAAPDEKGLGAADVTSGTAAFARRDKYVQFERHVRIQRGRQAIEAETAVARLSEDEKRIQSIELHDNAHINEPEGEPGSLRSTAGHDMNLMYAASGEALEHAIITGDATLQLAGAEAGTPGRQIDAKILDVVMGPDGSTPVSLTGHEAVQLTFPPEPGVPGRTIRAVHLDAKGDPGHGLTHATFTGGVQFRERGADIDRAAVSDTLELLLKPGFATIDEARFVRAVRFEESSMAAQAAIGRYDLTKGTLQLSGSEAGSLVPRVVNDRIAVDATTIDVTLAGPIVKAAGSVKSTLKPTKPGAAGPDGGSKTGPNDGNETRMPSMLKQDQPATVLAENLAYDGTEANATYTGAARLFQGDTTIKADTLTIDQKRGDMDGHGHIMTTTMRDQPADDTKGGPGRSTQPRPAAQPRPAGGQPPPDKDKTQRVQTIATSSDFKYEDAIRRMTYTGAAHMVGPEGDMSATRIELYLNESGDDVDRAEAYTENDDKMTLKEQNRTTTGSRMTYTAAKETYVVVGLPALVVDECGRETTGKTLTFVKSTDTIVVDGNQQVRTHTKGGTARCP